MAEEQQSTQTPLAEWAVGAAQTSAALALSQRERLFLLPQRITERYQLSAQKGARIDPQTAATTTPTDKNGNRRGSNLMGTTVEAPRVHSARSGIAERFSMVRKYEGRIIRRDADTFWAEFRENPDDSPIEAEFEIDALPASDRPLAVAGVPVVWTVGFDIQDGTHRQQSIVYLRRIPWPSSAEV
ncbi:MAG TPA: hypothetical protein VGM65_08280 [Candidatus Udaeobacter sp.]|jgi:hypothetical protein